MRTSVVVASLDQCPGAIITSKDVMRRASSKKLHNGAKSRNTEEKNVTRIAPSKESQANQPLKGRTFQRSFNKLNLATIPKATVNLNSDSNKSADEVTPPATT